MRECMKVGGLKLPVATSTTQLLSLIQTRDQKRSVTHKLTNFLVRILSP